jgi:tRNA(Met) cytidine acetyltransferase
MFDLLTGITSPEPQVAPKTELLVLVSDLLVQAQNSRQRRTLVITGKSDWCRHSASAISELTELKRVIWVSDAEVPGAELPEAEVVNASTVKSLLGQECDAVVFDAFSGFDPDAFGAISGTICAGGLLILLCPPLSEWEQFADPASERIAISPFSYEDISGRFIRRLVSVIHNADGVILVEQKNVEQDKPLPVIESAAVADESLDGFSNKEPTDECRTEDQEVAVKAVEHVLHGHRRRPAVLVSDRGRGKSAALGIAAAHLLINANNQTDGSKNVLNIVVTAPRPSAVESLFSHALRVLQQVLPEMKLVENALQFKGSKIQYVAPDKTIFAHRFCDDCAWL